MDEQNQTKFEGWALVEIMGHRRAVGEVQTVYIGSAAFLRIITPEIPATQYVLDRDVRVNGEYLSAGTKMESHRPLGEILVGSGSIYAITPLTEAQVLEHAPVHHKVLERVERAALAAPFDFAAEIHEGLPGQIEDDYSPF
jgi:hypothetical protein